MEQQKWAGTTFGSTWMHRQLVNSLRFIDVRLIYLFSALFVVPVCLLLNASRRTSWHYFRQRLGYGRLRAAWAVYLNHCMFSQTVVDRFAMFAGKKFTITMEGYEHFVYLSEQPDGFLQFSSHIGCYEIAGYSLVSENKRFNALVFGNEKATVMEGREGLFSHTNIRMIPVKADMSHLFVVNDALANNEIVSMPADRVFGSKKTIGVPFLGATAMFPMGPFSTATMRSLEAVAVNVMKTSTKGYTIYVTPLAYDHTASRKEQMQQLAASYVGELERIVRQYPHQWYNFYEFWS